MRRLSLIICFLSFSALMLTSCLESEDPYNAQFLFRKPSSPVTAIYANNVVDSIIVYSYGKWHLTADGYGDWCSINQKEGNAGTLYSIPVRFTQNTTGNSRYVTFNFVDASHPDEAYASKRFWQYATRGDGTLGSAADVKAITGSDGSRFDLTYDEQHRPLSLNIKLNDNTLHNMQLLYNDYDSILTVSDRSRTMTAHYGNDYQPSLLQGVSDTIGYYAQYYYGYLQSSASYAFNIEHHSNGQPTKRYAIKLGGQSLIPDSLHNADSLRIATDHLIENLKLSYSQTDNRRQSVDVNQLIFGTEQCDPYQLLSLFRYARNTSVISEATGKEEDERITVSTTLNANRSVSTLTVTRHGKQTVYTFEY